MHLDHKAHLYVSSHKTGCIIPFPLLETGKCYIHPWAEDVSTIAVTAYQWQSWKKPQHILDTGRSHSEAFSVSIMLPQQWTKAKPNQTNASQFFFNQAPTQWVSPSCTATSSELIHFHLEEIGKLLILMLRLREWTKLTAVSGAVVSSYKPLQGTQMRFIAPTRRGSQPIRNSKDPMPSLGFRGHQQGSGRSWNLENS